MFTNFHLKLCFIRIKPTIQIPDLVMIICFNTFLSAMIPLFWFSCRILTFYEDITWARVNAHTVFDSCNTHWEGKGVCGWFKFKGLDFEMTVIRLTFQLMIYRVILLLRFEEVFLQEVDVMRQPRLCFMLKPLFLSQHVMTMNLKVLRFVFITVLELNRNLSKSLMNNEADDKEWQKHFFHLIYGIKFCVTLILISTCEFSTKIVRLWNIFHK